MEESLSGKGIEKWKSRAVRGVYCRERYCVGGLAFTGMIDSSGTEPGLLVVVCGDVTAAAGCAESVDGLCFAPSGPAGGFFCCCIANDPKRGDANAGRLMLGLRLFGVRRPVCAAFNIREGTGVLSASTVSAAHRSCLSLPPILSFRSFGRSRKSSRPSRAFRTSSKAICAMTGLVSRP